MLVVEALPDQRRWGRLPRKRSCLRPIGPGGSGGAYSAWRQQPGTRLPRRDAKARSVNRSGLLRGGRAYPVWDQDVETDRMES
jgi:hypothetical protein